MHNSLINSRLKSITLIPIGVCALASTPSSLHILCVCISTAYSVSPPSYKSRRWPFRSSIRPYLAKEEHAKWGSALVPPIIIHNLLEAEDGVAKTTHELQSI